MSVGTANVEDSLHADVSSPGRLLARARAGAGLTQTELARRLGVSQAAVAELERPSSNPRIATLDRALRAAGAELRLSARPRGGTSIDESLVRQQLALSPTERLRGLEAMYEHARALASAGAASRGESA
jgi:transcriptional regulator with XRE-family HTH domain